MKLSVKVVAGSSQNCIVGWLDKTLKVRVRATREKGKANTAVQRLLVEALELPPESIRISSGMTSSRKLVEITGLGESEVCDRLANLCN